MLVISYMTNQDYRMADLEGDALTEQDIIQSANVLLSKCNIEFTIEEVSECNSDLFLAIYHAILGDFPSDCLIDCSTAEGQVHNIKCILETLSSDYLKVDLSHISPQDLVQGDHLAIYNLLEILDGLLEYLLEKIGLDSDSGDEGDIDSDQLSDHARTLALQTIQKEMSRHSPTNTAELIALYNSNEDQNSSLENSNDFIALKPEVCHSCDLSSPRDSVKEKYELSNHTLHASVNLEENVSPPSLSDNSISESVASSFKELPTPTKDVNAISDTLAHLQVEKEDVSSSEIKSEGGLIDKFQIGPDHSPEPIVVSDSGSSMTSEACKAALDVDLDAGQSQFILEERRKSLHGESSASESEDVADGAKKPLKKHESANREISRPEDPIPPESRERDWQKMLNSLQKTVEESKKIRQQYFSSGGLRSMSTTEQQSSLGNETTTSIESLNDLQESKFRKRPKNVRFKETISTKTAKELADFRKFLQNEKKLQDEKNKMLMRSFEDHLSEVKQAEEDRIQPIRRRAKESEKEVREALKQEKKSGKISKSKQKRTSNDAAKRKGWLSPKVKKAGAKRTTSGIVRPQPPPSGLEVIGEHDLLPKLLGEFPQLELAPSTLNDMWHKQFRQIEQLSAASSVHNNKKRQSEMKLQEAHMKHELLTSIMQKDHEHTRHMREVKQRIAGQKETQRTLRERRLQTARIRRYYRDYHLQMRSRMLKRRTKEERIFKRLFEDGLEIQKARLRELRKYAKDKREEQKKQQMDEIQSLENYYQDQFNILAETLAQEKDDLKIRDAAQSKLVRDMKRGLRHKMEKEISQLQEMIARDDEDSYFREIEADRLRRQLQLATYNSKFKAA